MNRYFYSSDDRCYYRMSATFFAGKFLCELPGTGEHRLEWMPLKDSYAYAFTRATPGPLQNACGARSGRRLSLEVPYGEFQYVATVRCSA
ncbi:MAG TPA: hypothetical protein VGQ39_24475 [Pyrinomonadaceae bacterium]|jgi:hypothetical protein|nr:hypothetical protein [Pyrinomonadaceae bacterium]